MSHDINRDPEMWEFRELVGRRADAIWEEILSIADRNEGKLGVNSSHLHAMLASVCRVYSPKVREALAWCLDKGWLEDRGYLYVTNWLKYNGTREANKIPTGEQTRSPPILSYPIPSKKKPEPVDNSKEELKAIFDLAAILAGGNHDRFTDIKNWIGKTIREAQTGVDRGKPEFTRKIILRSIQALKKLGVINLDREGIFAYLTGAFKKIRTEEIQAESGKHKQAGVESAGEVLKRISEIK